MFAYWNGKDDIYTYADMLEDKPALYDTFTQGAKLGKRLLPNSHNAERLIGFEFDYSLIGDYPVERVRAIETWLQVRGP